MRPVGGKGEVGGAAEHVRLPDRHQIYALGGGVEVVGVEAHRGEGCGVGYALGLQRHPVLRAQLLLAAAGNAVFQVNAEVVQRDVRKPPIEDRAKGEVGGLFRGKRPAANQQSCRVGGRQGSLVLQHTGSEGGGDIQDVRLPHSRCPEAGADGAAECQLVVYVLASGDLEVGGFAYVVVVFVARRDTHAEAFSHFSFQVNVDGIAVPRPDASQPGAEAGEAIGAHTEALRRQAVASKILAQRALLPRHDSVIVPRAEVLEPRVAPALADLELLLPMLKANGQVQRRFESSHVNGALEVEVESVVRLRVGARVVLDGDVCSGEAGGKELRVDGVPHEELRLMAAIDAAGIEMPLAQVALDPEHDAEVRHLAAEAGHEAAGESSNEGFAIRVRSYSLDVRSASHAIDNANIRAGAIISGFAIVRVKVGHLDGVHHGGDHGAVHAGRHLFDFRAIEDAAAGVGVPVVEAAFHPALGVVDMAVGFPPVRQALAEVAEELVVVVELRRAPDHDIGVEDMVVAGIEQRLASRAAGVDVADGVVALLGPVGAVGLLVFNAEVGEAVAAPGEAFVGGEGHAIAIALVELAPAGFHCGAVRVVFQDEVDDAGNGVRAVLRRSAITQDLHLAERYGGDGGDIRPLGAIGYAIAEESDDRRPVPALVVDQHQSGVRRQAAQLRRAH